MMAAGIAGLLLLLEGSAAAAPTQAARTAIVPFETSPFPYSGRPPGQDKPFFDVEREGRRGHNSPRGGVYWEDETYSDRGVLLSIPRGFDCARPGLLIVFFHGNETDLQGVVARRQQLPRQVAQSGLNALLVAPQFARNALDSSAGRFYEAGHFRLFLQEAAARLAELSGDQSARLAIAALPVVIVAYSGGYLPAAWVAHHGGADGRLAGIILLDALYAETGKFAEWIMRRQTAFFFSAYSASASEGNLQLQRLLSERGIAFSTSLPAELAPASVTFLATGTEVAHGDFLRHAWAADPLARVLAKIKGLARSAPARGRQR